MIYSSIKKREIYNTLINAFLFIIYLKVNIHLNLLFKEKSIKTCKINIAIIKKHFNWDPPLLFAAVLWRRAVSGFTTPASSPRESLFTDDIESDRRFYLPIDRSSSPGIHSGQDFKLSTWRTRQQKRTREKLLWLP